MLRFSGSAYPTSDGGTQDGTPRSEYAHAARTFFCTLWRRLARLQSAFVDEISASERGRKFVKSAFVVGRGGREKSGIKTISKEEEEMLFGWVGEGGSTAEL